MIPRCCVIISWAVGVTSFAAVEAPGQAPEVVLRPSSAIPRFSVLTVRPHSTTWAFLEASSDLTNWQPVVNLLTTNRPFVDYSTTNSDG